MADPSLWASLKDTTVSVLTETLKDIVDVEKPEVKDLILEVGEEGAKQTWLLINGSDDEKAQAPGNLRSLHAHVIIDAADAVILSTKELRTAFLKIVQTAGGFLLASAERLISKI